MIEPSDVAHSTWVHDSNPVPVPEPNDMDSGRPRFLQRDMDRPIFRTVGQSFSYPLKLAGEKPIKVTMNEEMFDEKETLRELEVATINAHEKGATFTIRNLTKEMHGHHTFVFEATNQRGLIGGPRAKIYLIVQGKNSGG